MIQHVCRYLKSLVVTLSLFFFLACTGQKTGKSKINQTPLSYDIQDYDSNVDLPDSLRNNGSGDAVVDLFINPHGTVTGYNLKFIKLINGADTVKHYRYMDKPRTQNEYPEEIRKYIPFFSDFIERLPIQRRGGGDPEEPQTDYILTLPLRLE